MRQKLEVEITPEIEKVKYSILYKGWDPMQGVMQFGELNDSLTREVHRIMEFYQIDQLKILRITERKPPND